MCRETRALTLARSGFAPVTAIGIGIGIESERSPAPQETLSDLGFKPRLIGKNVAGAPSQPKLSADVPAPIARALAVANMAEFRIASEPQPGTKVAVRFPPERLVPAKKASSAPVTATG